jgi:hypothetical protein
MPDGTPGGHGFSRAAKAKKVEERLFRAASSGSTKKGALAHEVVGSTGCQWGLRKKSWLIK